MRRKIVFGTLAAALVLAANLQAQARFGVQANFGTDTDFGIGGRAIFGLQSLFPATPLDGHVTFDWFFPEGDATYWELNGNVAYRFPVQRNLGPYVGGGLNIAHISVDLPLGGTVSDTDAGLNVLGGISFGARGRAAPFVELRGELGGGEQLVITGGLRF
ncbi:MAG: hypothetical protein HYS40_04855 [Gemmatimonadetes bacterium]|nr:hypothetical protein [Gemmatimonadota bacterium]